MKALKMLNINPVRILLKSKSIGIKIRGFIRQCTLISKLIILGAVGEDKQIKDPRAKLSSIVLTPYDTETEA